MANATVVGLYSKYLNAASSLLRLPTVVVDVQDNGEDAYQLMTEFTCEATTGVIELRFSARTPEIDDATLEAMKEVAKSVGIDADTVDGVSVVDHSSC